MLYFLIISFIATFYIEPGRNLFFHSFTVKNVRAGMSAPLTSKGNIYTLKGDRAYRGFISSTGVASLAFVDLRKMLTNTTPPVTYVVNISRPGSTVYYTFNPPEDSIYAMWFGVSPLQITPANMSIAVDSGFLDTPKWAPYIIYSPIALSVLSLATSLVFFKRTSNASSNTLYPPPEAAGSPPNASSEDGDKGLSR